ncbi:hypothetical protein [Ruegeria atlantica]
MDRISAPEVIEDTRFHRRHVPFEDDVCPYSKIMHQRTSASVPS